MTIIHNEPYPEEEMAVEEDLEEENQNIQHNNKNTARQIYIQKNFG
jgi:hypothetical protein